MAYPAPPKLSAAAVSDLDVGRTFSCEFSISALDQVSTARRAL